MSVGVIIVAAGSGRRMGAAGNKVLLPLAGKPVLSHSLELFASMAEVTEIVVVTRAVDQIVIRTLGENLALQQRFKVVVGGKERQDSVYNGLQALSKELEWIIIHDGARPYLSEEVVRTGLQKVQTELAVGVAVPVKDTIKRVKKELVVETLLREELWAMQTPQIFAANLIRQAYLDAQARGFIATDDCALVESMGQKVAIIPGEYSNIKITTPEDLPMEERFLVGFGYDVHRLVVDRPLILAGVEIPHSVGLLGHSDADVVTHAIMDALLGAAGLGDLGELFPDTDPKYAGVSSLALLKIVVGKLEAIDLKISNLDITIMAQSPKLTPWKEQMRLSLAEVLGVSKAIINLKATTAEGLGFVGREEGIACQAVVALSSRNTYYY